MSFDTPSKKPKIIWLNVLVFIITSTVALIGVPLYGYFYGYDWGHLIATVLCIGYCGMSITAGYHRLWSHKAYQANALVRVIYAIGGAFAVQNSALHWASDHRVHHGHVDDNDKDPYSAKKGFWYSHIGWMLREYQAHRYQDYSNVKDLQRDPVVMWQHKHYLVLTLAANFGIPLLIGVIHGDIWGMLLTAGFLRLVISHHVTFFINSLAHIWGSQPYNVKNTARDNGFIALFTFGEGYHNFHHHFQNDYRNGIKWWQFDPTKWLIRLLSVIGFANNLKRSDDTKIELAKAETLMQKASQQLANINLPDKDTLLESRKAEYDSYTQQLMDFYDVKRQWVNAHKKQLLESPEAQEIVHKYQELCEHIQEQREKWQAFHQQLKLKYQAV